MFAVLPLLPCSCANFLDRIEYGALVITPGDRSDVILACLAAGESMTMPNISGILLDRRAGS